MVSYQYLRYTTWSPGIAHNVSKYHSKIIFNAHWNLYSSKRSMGLFPEFHGIFFQTTFEQQLWFHGIPWNLSSSSMEFHGFFFWDPKFHEIPSNLFHTPELHGIPRKTMGHLIIQKKLHGIPWKLINLIFKEVIFLKIVFLVFDWW